MALCLVYFVIPTPETRGHGCQFQHLTSLVTSSNSAHCLSVLVVLWHDKDKSICTNYWNFFKDFLKIYIIFKFWLIFIKYRHYWVVVDPSFCETVNGPYSWAVGQLFKGACLNWGWCAPFAQNRWFFKQGLMKMFVYCCPTNDMF